MSASARLYTELANSVKATIETFNVNHDEYAKGGLSAISCLVNLIRVDLANDNPRFNEARFLAACGLPPRPTD